LWWCGALRPRGHHGTDEEKAASVACRELRCGHARHGWWRPEAEQALGVTRGEGPARRGARREGDTGVRRSGDRRRGPRCVLDSVGKQSAAVAASGQHRCTVAARLRCQGGVMLGMEAGMASPSLVVASMATTPLGEEPEARATGEGDTDGAGGLLEQEEGG
jgi:hypothetical protein